MLYFLKAGGSRISNMTMDPDPTTMDPTTANPTTLDLTTTDPRTTDPRTTPNGYNNNGFNDNRLSYSNNRSNYNEDNDNKYNLNQIFRIISRTFLEHLVVYDIWLQDISARVNKLAKLRRGQSRVNFDSRKLRLCNLLNHLQLPCQTLDKDPKPMNGRNLLGLGFDLLGKSDHQTPTFSKTDLLSE